jgi:hypothetical protein
MKTLTTFDPNVFLLTVMVCFVQNSVKSEPHTEPVLELQNSEILALFSKYFWSHPNKVNN